MSDKRNPIRETDDEARAIAKALLAEARIASLAFIDPETGGPSVSRIIIADFGKARLATLISDLSLHTKALVQNPQCALLIGEPGKGDPLAHPRMTILAKAARMPDEAKDDTAFAAQFQALHPKTQLYFGFADFAFWHFETIRIDLNGGFGKAYRLQPDDVA
jgi:heme iron utilization protein